MTTPRETLERQLTQLLEAYQDTRYHELEDEWIIVDQVDDVTTVLASPFIDDPDETEATSGMRSWRRTLEPLVEYYMDAHWKDAVGIADILDDAAYQLRLNSGVEEGSDPRGEIETSIAGWTGAAADKFRLKHLPHMDNALRFQHEFALALSDVIKTHAAIVKTAYKQAKDLMQQAREMLDAETERLERESREQLMQLVSDIVLVGVAYATGGPKDAVKTSLEKVGEAIADLEFSPSGKANDIMSDLERALRSLKGYVQDEQEHVRHALDRLDNFLNGDRANDFLPLYVEVALRTGTL